MADVSILITADGDRAVKELKRVGDTADDSTGKLGKLGGALSDVGKIAGGIVLAKAVQELPGFLISAAQAAAEDEAATMRLEKALRNAGGAFDEHIGKVNERIAAGAKLAFSDDQVRDSFQTLLAATGDVDEALRRQALAMDFARGAGIPLEQATKLLGKVTEENVEVFKRMGITIGEGATEAEAFAVIQEKFAGQAETYAKSTAGQFDQTKIKMGELKEQIGAQLLPVMAKIGTALVEDVIPKLEQFAAYWDKNVQPEIAKFVAFVQTEVMPKVKAEFAKFQTYYESDIKPAIENIKTAIVEVVTWIKNHWGQIEPFVRPIFALIEFNFKTMVNGIKILIDILGGDWKGAWDGMKEQAELVLELVTTLFGTAKDQLVVIAGLMGRAFEGFANAVERDMRKAVGFIVDLINTAIGAYNMLPGVSDIQKIGQAAAAAGSGSGPLAPSLPVYGPDRPIEGPMPFQDPFENWRENLQMGGGAGGGGPTGAYGQPLTWTGSYWSQAGATMQGPGAQHATITIVQNIGSVGSKGEAAMLMQDGAYALATRGL